MDLNSVTLTGRITRDLELKQTNNGKSVVNFSLAVGKDKDTTYFVDCSMWNKGAELLAQYCKKGSKIGVNGILTTRTYDGQNGKVKVVEVLVNNLTFLDSKQQEEKQTSKQSYNAMDSSDLPF